MLTREMIKKCRQLPKWRSFYIIGPGKRPYDFGYIGPACQKSSEINKNDKIDYMDTVPSVSTIINQLRH